MIDRSAVTGAVLAGGESRRFGPQNKLLATVGGRPLLARAVDAVDRATGSDPILCLAERSDWADLRHAVGDTSPEICTDVSDDEGPVAAVTAAARTAESPWLFCVGGDMPTIEESAVRRLRSEAAAREIDRDTARGTALGTAPDTSHDTVPDAIVPVIDENPQPLHALYRTESLRAALEDTPRPNSLRGVLSSLSSTVAVKAGACLRRSVQNVNTWADLRRVANRGAESRRVR